MSKAKCPECGGRMRVRAAPIEIHVGRHRVTDNTVPVPTCEKCGTSLISQKEMEESERRAALRVLKDVEGPSGDVLRFARKALGLRQVDLATALGKTFETVCRWEKDEHIPRTLSLAMAHILTIYDQDREAFDQLVGLADGPSSDSPSRTERKRRTA